MINRVICVDLFDTLFQGDPFNHFLRKHEVHMVRELLRNREHGCGLIWPRCYFPNYHYNDPNDFQINSGYIGGYVDEFLSFMNVFCQYTKYNRI